MKSTSWKHWQYTAPDGEIVLTYSNHLDERHSEVVLISHICVHVLLVDAEQGEAEQRKQRRYGEAEVELEQTWQLRPGLYLQEGGDGEVKEMLYNLW